MLTYIIKIHNRTTTQITYLQVNLNETPGENIRRQKHDETSTRVFPFTFKKLSIPYMQFNIKQLESKCRNFQIIF